MAPKRTRGGGNGRRRKRRRTRGVTKRSSIHTSTLKLRGRSSGVTIRGNTILPQQLRTVLPYADLIQTSTTLTNPGIYTYRINSLFDPDKTGAGMFPTGREELKDLYFKYLVFGMSYDITCINMSSVVPIRACVVASSTDSVWSTFQEVQSQPNASKPIILGTLDGGNAVGKLRGYISVANTQGVPRKTVSIDDTYSALWGANPAEVSFLQIVHGNLDGSATTDLHMEVALKFYIRAYDLQPLAQTS